MSNCFLCNERTYNYIEKIQKHVCRECMTNKYASEGNDDVVGTVNILPSFSFEFEVGNKEATAEYRYSNDECHGDHSYYNEDEECWDEYECDCESEYDDEEDADDDGIIEFYSPALLLLEHNFIRCSDCTVHAEYKSPIYQSMQPLYALREVLRECDNLVGDEAGTHIHVGTRNKQAIQRNYHAIFDNLLDAMEDDQRVTTKVFGRYFNSYARREYSGRYRAINTETSYDTIEFRLSQFRNTNQFFNLVSMVRKFIFVIDRELDKPTNERNYATLSQLLVQIFHKHSAIVLHREPVKVVFGVRKPRVIAQAVVETTMYCTTLKFASQMDVRYARHYLLQEGMEVFETMDDTIVEVRSTVPFRYQQWCLVEHYINHHVLVDSRELAWIA